ncbi:MAG: DUF1810 domain-containing protein [Parabacteroides sp.]|nr:DUF1810 domain-containing protein [Parabacteroides sp.]
MNTYNLQRFLDAQDRYDSTQSALEELRQDRKRSHWIWFILQEMFGELQPPINEKSHPSRTANLNC